jgi:hypothetical protein
MSTGLYSTSTSDPAPNTPGTGSNPTNTLAAGGTGPTPGNPYQDDDAILSLVRRKMEEWARGREAQIRGDWRNILFYRGHQWVVFDRTMNRWRPSRLKPRTPTPVTNRFGSSMDTFISLLARVEPRLQFPPATDDPEDQATADVCDRIMEVIEDEVGIRYARQFLAVWNGLTGGVWLETGYDPDPIHGMVPLDLGPTAPPEEMNPPLNTQPPNTAASMLSDEMLEPPAPQMVPRGKMYVDVCSKFEMYFDPAITDWKKQRRYVRQKTVSIDEAKSRWPDFADKITPDSLTSPGEFYHESLPTLGTNVDDTQATRLAGNIGPRLQNTRVTEQWYWSLPDETYPQGLLAIVVGRHNLVHKGPVPTTALESDGSRTPFLPHVYFPQKLVPGTMWPKTIADDLAHKQAQRNRFESLCEQTAMRMANPVWLIPEGANVANVTGEAGQIIKYNALGPSPAKPERIPGQNISATLIQMIEIIDKDFEELAGLFDVLKGSRPAGVSAGIALQLLKERGESRFAPMFILWESAWAEWGRQALEIFREYVTEERIRQIKGRDGNWQVEKFLGADLKGRVNVVPEAASSFPKSTLTERAEVEQLVALGALNPVADAEVRYKMLKQYGKLDWIPALAADTKNAMMENEIFDKLGQNTQLAQMPPQNVAAMAQLLQAQPGIVTQELAQFGIQIPRVRPAVDDHAVHSREHGEWLKSEHSQMLPLVVQLLAEEHKKEHDQLQLAAAQAAAGMGAPPSPTAGFLSNPGGQTGPMNAGSSPQRMGGDTQEMQHAVVHGGG